VSYITRRTRAARTTTNSLRLLSFTGRLITLKFTLRLRASSRLLALPVTLSFFTHRSADRFGSNTGSTAVSRRADSFALRAIVLFAHILRATNVTLGLIAVDLALSTGSLFALNLALGTFANRVALSRAHGVIALPSALGVAFSFSFHHRSRGKSGHK